MYPATRRAVMRARDQSGSEVMYSFLAFLMILRSQRALKADELRAIDRSGLAVRLMPRREKTLHTG